jgi:hypothetical protein
MNGVAEESTAEGAVGVTLCLIAAGFGEVSALVTQESAFAARGMGFAGQVAKGQVSAVAWIGVLVEAIHTLLAWLGGHESKGGE